MSQSIAIRTNARRLLLVAALSGAATVLSACSEEPAKTEAEVPRVKVVAVEPKHEVTNLVYSGSVKARVEMNMGFRLSGKITERLVNVGDRVKQGDLLMRLDGIDIKLAVERAEASLAAAKQQFETADAAYRRADQLYRDHTIAIALLEQRKLALDQADAARISAQSAVNEAKNQLSYTELKADRDGVVTGVYGEAGQVIGAGSVAVTVAQDKEKEVQIAVPEMDVGAFSIGQTVSARFWADKSIALTGKVREIAASADPLSRTFAIRISLDNDPRVLLGMTATIEAERKSAETGVTIPLTALSTQNGETVVWLVDPQTETVSARPVKAEAYSGDGVRIGDGLQMGDVVVIAGTQFMTDKRHVLLPEGMKENLAATGTVKPAS